MSQRTTWLIITCAVLGSLGGFVAGQMLLSPKTGRADPGIRVAVDAATQLIDLTGKRRSLDEWKGRARLVNVWASWCGPCRDEMPLLDALHASGGSSGVQVIGVADDNADSVQRYLAQEPVTYPILIDDSGTGGVAKSLGNTRDVLPYTVLLAADGTVLDSHFGRFDDEAQLREFVRPAL